MINVLTLMYVVHM